MVVRPSWESNAGAAAEFDIEIDPGQAFGTGGHHTTRLCLEFLLELVDDGEARGPLVDLGTGSGVLAIAAAKLGWDPVSGYDSEAASIEAATANAQINGVALALERLNLRESRVPATPTIVANLTAPLLETVAGRLDAAPETLVCSGLLASEIDRVTAAMDAAGLGVEAQKRGGDWAALLCRKR
jgi:ribosomal protein L11 methyltransferase